MVPNLIALIAVLAALGGLLAALAHPDALPQRRLISCVAPPVPSELPDIDAVAGDECGRRTRP
jgi:hypothetical protein